MKTSTLPVMVAAILGLSLTIALGVFQFSVLISIESVPSWAHHAFAVLIGSLAVCSITLMRIHLRDLRHQPSKPRSETKLH